jgi:hypothetical protein
MAELSHIDGWPTEFSRLASVAQLHALGQVTLVYNYLEEQISRVFYRCMPTSGDFSSRLFHKLGNRDRIDLLSAVVSASDYLPEAKEALLHLLTCYDICTENRNILMHAIIESADADILTLSKTASNDPARYIHFRLPISDLRLVADQMAEAFTYALRLENWVAAQTGLFAGPIIQTSSLGSQFDLSKHIAALGTLPGKPPKPRKLTPYQPPATQPDGARQPQS